MTVYFPSCDLEQALIRSSADINGLSGQGMLIFVELMGWLHGALFNFVRDNQALQIKVTVADLLRLVGPC